MAKFKEGEWYECNGSGIDPILIIKRTAKMCLVRNLGGNQWRMMIRQDGENEIMTDSAVPQKWRPIYTYNARHIIKEDKA